MIFSVFPSQYLQRLLEHRLRILPPRLDSIQLGEVVERRRHVRVVLAEPFLRLHQRAL